MREAAHPREPSKRLPADDSGLCARSKGRLFWSHFEGSASTRYMVRVPAFVGVRLMPSIVHEFQGAQDQPASIVAQAMLAQVWLIVCCGSRAYSNPSLEHVVVQGHTPTISLEHVVAQGHTPTLPSTHAVGQGTRKLMAGWEGFRAMILGVPCTSVVHPAPKLCEHKQRRQCTQC